MPIFCRSKAQTLYRVARAIQVGEAREGKLFGIFWKFEYYSEKWRRKKRINLRI